MKKSILLILLLISPSVFAADTVTSGSVGFLKPAVGVVDTTRSWADKYNSNWDIAAASMTTVLTSISGVAASTGASNTAFRAYTSSADARFNGLTVDTAAIANRPFVTTIYDEGAVQGNITTLNFVGGNIAATLSGSTGTVTVTAAGGGSGVGSSTFNYTLGLDGPVFLSTTVPFSSFFQNKSTFTVLGWQACAQKASSSSATMLELAWSSSTIGTSASGGGSASPGNYGVIYTPFTFKLEITTQARCSVYQSTVVPIWQEMEWGVRITTVTDPRNTVSSGLPAEGLRVNIFGWENRSTTW